MKKVVIMALSCALVTTATAQCFITNGLVAYFPFNGNANDASGNGNNGTVNGATFTSDRYGVSNRAIFFSTNSVTTSFFPPTGTSGRTVSLWFNAHSTGSEMTFLSYGGNNVYWGDRFEVKMMSYGGLGLDVSGSGVTTGTTYNDGKWHQVVLSVPTNAILSSVGIYIDGIFQESTNLSYYNNPAINTSQIFALQFGQLYLNGDNRYLTGSLDDVRIYNCPLSSNDVKQLYFLESIPKVYLQKAVTVTSDNLRVGSNYIVQASSDLINWTNQGSAFTANTNVWHSTNYWDVADWNQLYFRVQMQ